MRITYAYDGVGFTVYPVAKKHRYWKEEYTLPGDFRRRVKLHGRSMYYQVDYDWPALAGMFGWRMAKPKGCQHRSTDGTVDCRDCGKSASEFITEAHDYLIQHEGKAVNDELDLF